MSASDFGTGRVYGLVQAMAGADGVPLPRRPNVVDADGWSEPLYETLLTDTDEPLVVNVPFHTWAIVCPGLNGHFTVQPLMALLPAVTVTSPWKPPDHELTVR